MAVIRRRGLLLSTQAKCLLVVAVVTVWLSPTAKSGPVSVRRDDNRTELQLGTSTPFHHTDLPVTDVRETQVSNSDVHILTWNEVDLDGVSAPFFGISLDGISVDAVRRASNELDLMYARFDPELETVSVSANLQARETSTLFIIQLVCGPVQSITDVLESRGAKVHQFVPPQAFLATVPVSARIGIEALPFVRSVVAYHPAFRLEGSVLSALSGIAAAGFQDTYSIAMLDSNFSRQQSVAAQITALGGCVRTLSPGSTRIEATLSLDQLVEVAHLDDVFFIDVPGQIEQDLDIVREISGANYLGTLEGFSGHGVRGEVMDYGFLDTHDAFEHDGGPIRHGPVTASNDHGTNTYGIAFGDGTGNSSGTGLLPSATGIFAPVVVAHSEPSDNCASIPSLGARYTHTSQLVQPTHCPTSPPDSNCPYNAVFQSNSWGHSTKTTYTTLSAEMDHILFDLDILICQSQANTGSQLSRPEAWAKNIVSVGGIRHFGTLDHADDRWSGGGYSCNSGTASIGPASDGRIKPDLTHFSDCVLTTDNDGDLDYTPFFGGTSAATPITCGYFGLLFQMWHEQVFPGFGGGASVFASRPHAATAKAMMINTAYRYPLNLDNNLLPYCSRFTQGWGMVDIAALHAVRNNILIINETDLLTEYATKSYSFFVATGHPALRVTMVYSDPPGSPCSPTHTVNDLSLKVVSPFGAVYWGNHRLTTSNWSTPDTTPLVRTPGVEWDQKNTVENVFVFDPQPGTWAVTVIADGINQDGHVETPAMDADYALVISSGPRPRGQCCTDEGTTCSYTTPAECSVLAGYWYS